MSHASHSTCLPSVTGKKEHNFSACLCSVSWWQLWSCRRLSVCCSKCISLTVLHFIFLLYWGSCDAGLVILRLKWFYYKVALYCVHVFSCIWPRWTEQKQWTGKDFHATVFSSQSHLNLASCFKLTTKLKHQFVLRFHLKYSRAFHLYSMVVWTKLNSSDLSSKTSAFGWIIQYHQKHTTASYMKTNF